jgi:hypothetical protein
MKYLPPLTGDLLEAYSSMPKLDGHVVSLFYTPEGRVPAYEQQWRKWLSEHSRHLWPEWVDQWSAHRKVQQKAA